VHGRIGELAMDWATTAIAIPDGDGHPLVPVVAAWAAWGATMAGDLEQAADLVAAAERAQAALGTRLPSVARAQATLAFYRTDFEEARRHAQEWVELARASGDASELAHALLMLGAALQVTEPTLDAASAAVDEAVRVARAAGIDVALATGLLMVATWLPYEESERALGLLEEAIEIGTRIGDRSGVSNAIHYKARIAMRHCDWPTALQGAVDAAEQTLEHGDHGVASRSLYTAGVALWALGSCEPAAVVFGKSDAMAGRWGLDWSLEMLAATEVALLEALGEQRVATLAARGAALDMADAVTYLRAEAGRALGAP
jgi:tetratricopeptide (TPR) repeat protein